MAGFNLRKGESDLVRVNAWVTNPFADFEVTVSQPLGHDVSVDIVDVRLVSLNTASPVPL